MKQHKLRHFIIYVFYAGTSMGLNSISFTNDTNENRTPDVSSIAASIPPFDTKLLGQLKHLLPGKAKA